MKYLKKRKVRPAVAQQQQQQGSGRHRGASLDGNPRSSPREMGVVRSDQDMEEIIAKIEADEAQAQRFERNLAVIPAMILDSKEKIARRFIDNNSLVEDPVHENRLHALVNTWQESEKKIFLEKFLAFPKNFRKISTYLPYKSPNECSEHYYMVKKQLDLKNLVKENNVKKKAKAAEMAQQKAKGAAKGSLIAKRRNSEDEGCQDGEGKKPQKEVKRAKTWTEEDKQKFINAMKEHGKDWKKLNKALGYSYAELRGLYTTWKDMIDPMLNAVARERKRKAAAEREIRAEAAALKDEQEFMSGAPVEENAERMTRGAKMEEEAQEEGAAVVQDSGAPVKPEKVEPESQPLSALTEPPTPPSLQVKTEPVLKEMAPIAPPAPVSAVTPVLTPVDTPAVHVFENPPTGSPVVAPAAAAVDPPPSVVGEEED